MRLRDRVALVTGAGRNIGRRIAVAMAEEGADVVVNIRTNVVEGEKVASEVRALGRQALVFPADVADPSAVQTMVDCVLGSFGRIDILVSNVSVRPHLPFLELTLDQWERVRSVNLDGAFYCARAILPSMVAQKFGRVVFVAGDGAWNVRPERAHLAASKMALVGLSRGLAAEMASQNVRVNVLSPGRTSTKRTDESRPSHEVESVPLGRLGTVDDMASACVFLVSDASDFITGQTLHVNGGSAFF